MNVLPSILVTAALACGTGHPSGNLTENLCPTLPSLEVNTTICSQEDISSLLEYLGINNNFLQGCFPSLTPDSNIPENNLPEQDNIPDSENNVNQENNANQENTLIYTQQVTDLVNAERSKAGLPALTMTAELNTAALTRAKETTISFSHTRPNGSSFSSVLTENGISYQSTGENIAWGQKTPEEVVNAWMNSEGHKANILNSSFTSIGVGCYENNGILYWVQLFTR